MADPSELADDLEAVIHGAEPALRDEELDAIGRAIEYLREQADNQADSSE